MGLSNLETTALNYFSFSPHTAHEGGMFDVELMEHLQAGDGLLGDRLYGSRAWRRCHGAMEVKMLTMYAIAHNLVHQAVRAAGGQGVGEHSMRLSFKGALDGHLALRHRNGSGHLQGMAQSATKTLPHHRHRLTAQTFQTLRTQSRQTTTKTFSADDAAARSIEATYPR